MPDASAPADTAANPAADTAAAHPDTGTTSTETPALTAPISTDPTPPAADTAADKALADQLAKERANAEKWKALAQKHEGRAKANADAQAQLEELKRANMTEQERIVEEVRAQVRAEAMREFGGALVHAEFRAAAGGRLDSEALDTLLGAVDLSRFIDDDGKPKSDEVSKFLDAVAPKPVEPAPVDPPVQPPAAAQSAGLPPLAPHPGDTGQGAARSSTIPLNGDPIERKMRAALGMG